MAARLTARSKKPASRPVAGASGLLDAATALIHRVLRFEAPADMVLGEFFREQRQWGSRERALLGDVTYRVLREWHALRHQGRGAPDGPNDADRRLALLAWPEAQWDKLALDGATQAWIAQARAVPLPDEQSHHLPAWLAQALRTRLGEDGLHALASSLQAQAPLDLRVNALRAKRDDVLQKLAEAGIEARPTTYAPHGLRLEGRPSLSKLEVMTQGLAEVQDEGSQLLAVLVDARRGEMVADFCAGGGGKTLALGAAMRDSGRLYAMDTAASRLAALAPRAKRAGLHNVYTMTLESEADARLDRLAGKLDRVLVDAPCSGLGTLRRSPELKWRLREDGLPSLVATQERILLAAARLLRPGGRLVYATCSLLDAENEAVVNRFLALRRDFRAVDVCQVLAAARVRHADSLVEDGFLRLWPHLHGTDGFFAAVLLRQD